MRRKRIATIDKNNVLWIDKHTRVMFPHPHRRTFAVLRDGEVISESLTAIDYNPTPYMAQVALFDAIYEFVDIPHSFDALQEYLKTLFPLSDNYNVLGWIREERAMDFNLLTSPIYCTGEFPSYALFGVDRLAAWVYTETGVTVLQLTGEATHNPCYARMVLHLLLQTHGIKYTKFGYERLRGMIPISVPDRYLRLIENRAGMSHIGVLAREG